MSLITLYVLGYTLDICRDIGFYCQPDFMGFNLWMKRCSIMLKDKSVNVCVRVCVCVCACVSTGQQLMLTGTTPAAVTPQAPYPGYGYAAPGFPPQPAYGFNM